MRLIPTPLVIDEEDDYESKTVINRGEFGDFLTKIVRTTTEPLVIAIDGRWGEGKTTFVKIWRNQLECTGKKWKEEAAEKRIPTLYIDAFKMEATDDIFISLVAEIDAFVRSECGNKEILDSLKEKAINLGVKLLPIAAKAAVNFITLNALSNSGIDKLELNRDTISKTLSEQAEKLLEERLESLASQKQIIDEFRDKLTDLPGSIENNPSKQLVIIVDELDRCSPRYAVDFLEKIKHFFSTDRIKFVLVINKNQLKESIRAIHGQGINSNEYLQKFIDVEAALPNDHKELNKSDTEKFCDSLFQRHGFEKDVFSHEFKKFVSEFSYYSKLSLRQIEKIFMRFALVKFANSTNFSSWDSPWTELVAYLSIVKVLDNEHFDDFANLLHSGNKVEHFFSRNLKGAKVSRAFSDKMKNIQYICMNAGEFEIATDKKVKDRIDLLINSDEAIREIAISTICRAISAFDFR